MHIYRRGTTLVQKSHSNATFPWFLVVKGTPHAGTLRKRAEWAMAWHNTTPRYRARPSNSKILVRFFKTVHIAFCRSLCCKNQKQCCCQCSSYFAVLLCLLVMDIGAGSGILSIFCAKVGAKHGMLEKVRLVSSSSCFVVC